MRREEFKFTVKAGLGAIDFNPPPYIEKMMKRPILIKSILRIGCSHPAVLSIKTEGEEMLNKLCLRCGKQWEDIW